MATTEPVLLVLISIVDGKEPTLSSNLPSSKLNDYVKNYTVTEKSCSTSISMVTLVRKTVSCMETRNKGGCFLI